MTLLMMFATPNLAHPQTKDPKNTVGTPVGMCARACVRACVSVALDAGGPVQVRTDANGG